MKKRGVCEKSMELVLNIIKLFSFSAAPMKSKSQISSRSSQTPAAVADDENFSDYIKRFHARNNNTFTDRKASAFINKFHQNNSRHYTPSSASASASRQLIDAFTFSS